jgi:hypothetical protein
MDEINRHEIVTIPFSYQNIHILNRFQVVNGNELRHFFDKNVQHIEDAIHPKQLNKIAANKMTIVKAR